MNLQICSLLRMSSTISTNHWKKYVSGCAASATNILCTYPFIKIGWRQIIMDVGTANATRGVMQEGRQFIYRGVMPTLIYKSLTISMMFGVHSQVYGFSTKHSMTPVQANITGGLATAVVQTTFMPFERVQTLLIAEKYNHVYKNTYDALVQIYRIGGVREFYRGMVVTAWRNMAAQSSFFVFKYNFDRRTEIIKIPALRNAAYFFEGGVLASFSYAFFYPLVALRVTMQKEVGGPLERVREVARKMYEKNKLRAFYRGVHVSVLRAFLGGGIINSSYEIYMATLNKIFD